MFFLKRVNLKFLNVILLSIIFSLFISRNLFTNKLFRTDDLELHGARLANYYLALKQGQLPPYWAPNLNYGFGYPVFLFSYSLPYFIAVIFYSLGAIIELSLNLTIFLFILIGGLGAFYYTYLKRKNLFFALTASIFYQTTPYVLLNIFVRGAVGEIAFLAFIPWLFTIIEQRKTFNKLWLFISSILIFAALILSHQPLLMIFTPVILIWLIRDKFFSDLIAWKKQPNSLILLLSALIALGLTAFNWLPFILEKSNIVIANHSITSNYVKRFISLNQLFSWQWGYGGADFSKEKDVLPLMIGLPIILVVIFLLKDIVLKKTNPQRKNEIIFWLAILVISLYLTLPASKLIWQIFPVLAFLQYPWRFLSLMAVSGLMLFSLLNKKTLFLILLLFISFYYAIFYAKPLSYISNSNHDWLEYPGSGTSDNELKTIWFDEHQNIWLTDKIFVESNGSYKVNELSWSGSKMIYEIENSESANIVQKTMYFPGWEVNLNQTRIPINYQSEKFPGRITFNIPAGKNLIEVKFTNNTPARKIGIYLFIFSFSCFLLIISWYFLKKITKQK